LPVDYWNRPQLNSNPLNRSSWRRILFTVLFPLLVYLGCHPGATRKTTPVFVFDRLEGARVVMDSTLAPDPAIEQYVAPYRQRLQEMMSTVIGEAAEDLFRARPDGPLNRFIAGAMLEQVKKYTADTVQVAVTNIGGIRANITAGPIRLGKIYEVLPFENELVIVELTGEQLLQLAREIAEVGGECIAGMTLYVRGRELVRVELDSGPLRDDRVYRVVTTDYLSAPGRQRLGTLSRGKRIFLGIKHRQAIIDAIRERQQRGEPIRDPGKTRFIEVAENGNSRG